MTISVFDRPDFREWEQQHQEKQRHHIKSRGYELVNVSQAFPGIREIKSIDCIRPEYELREISTGKRISGMIDCTYFQVLNWATRYVDDLAIETPAIKQDTE